MNDNFRELHILGDNDTHEDPRKYTEAMFDIDSKRWPRGHEIRDGFNLSKSGLNSSRLSRRYNTYWKQMGLQEEDGR